MVGRREQFPAEEVLYPNQSIPADLWYCGQFPAKEVPYLDRTVLDLGYEQFPAEEVQHRDWDVLDREEENHDTDFSFGNPYHQRDSFWERRENRQNDLGFIMELPELSGTSLAEESIQWVNEVETPSEPVYDDYNEIEEFRTLVYDEHGMEEELEKFGVPVYDDVLYGEDQETLVLGDVEIDWISIDIYDGMNMVSEEVASMVMDPAKKADDEVVKDELKEAIHVIHMKHDSLVPKGIGVQIPTPPPSVRPHLGLELDRSTLVRPQLGSTSLQINLGTGLSLTDIEFDLGIVQLRLGCGLGVGTIYNLPQRQVMELIKKCYLRRGMRSYAMSAFSVLKNGSVIDDMTVYDCKKSSALKKELTGCASVNAKHAGQMIAESPDLISWDLEWKIAWSLCLEKSKDNDVNSRTSSFQLGETDAGRSENLDRPHYRIGLDLGLPIPTSD